MYMCILICTYVSEAAIPQIVAIRYRTLQTVFLIRSRIFGVQAACCSVPYFHALLSIIHFARFCSFFIFSYIVNLCTTKFL